MTVNGDIKPIGHCESVKMLPTTDNLTKVEARQTWLDTERQKREEQIQNYYDELCVLWTRLGVPEDEQEQFVESWRGLSEQCVEGYEAELKRMIEAKKEHMVLFVQKERDSIIALWDQMYVAEQERASHAMMYSEDYSEELLASHEKLKVQLLDDLSDKKSLLLLLNRYFKLLQEAHELELAEKDPNRFAKGQRGDPGRLLREEKIRKRVAKEKPKLETDLKTLIPQWENERGRPFMVNGSRFLEDLVIRLEQEAASKPTTSVARSRTTASSTSTQSAKRQQTGSQSRTASPVKRTRTEAGEPARSKPPVSAVRGSANPFGSATPRIASKASSVTSTARQKLAPQATGTSSVYNTRFNRSNTQTGSSLVPLKYQRTGSAMSYYNPVTPTPVSRGPPSMASTAETTSVSDRRLLSSQETGCDTQTTTDPSVRSVSAQSSCPGIPPGWPTTNSNQDYQPIPRPTIQPPPPNLKYTNRLGHHSTLGKGMPAPPLKKGIFKPRPSTILSAPADGGGPLTLINSNQAQPQLNSCILKSQNYAHGHLQALDDHLEIINTDSNDLPTRTSANFPSPLTSPLHKSIESFIISDENLKN